MKRIYKLLIKILMGLVDRTEKLKTWTAEWIAILRKRKLYRDIRWTKDQQRAFDAFWKAHYGKRISNRWHKLYQASNGVFRIDYLPEILYSTKIEPRLNNRTYCAVYADKALNELFFNGRMEGVRTPVCYLSNNHGRFFDGERHLLSREDAVKLLGDVGQAVIKPTVDSSSGKNVRIVDMRDGINVRDGSTAAAILNAYGSNFIVQEKITPCDELATLYPTSINTIRTISYIVGDRIEVAPISLRIGGGGSEVDNIHAGGMSISVSPFGSLAQKAYRLGYGDSFESFSAHPDTGIVFEGYRLSFTDKLIATAKRLHEMTANIGIISWDFTVDAKGDVVVIEANFRGQSVWFPQMLSGEAFYGEHTAEVLQELFRTK